MPYTLESDPVRALCWLAGSSSGWVEKAPVTHGLQCKLCGNRVNAQSMLDHGMAHLNSVSVELDAMLTLISLVALERQPEKSGTQVSRTQSTISRCFAEATEQVFGFRPGTTAALQFWKEHGEEG